MQIRKQQLEMDMEQQTGSKSGKEYVKTVYLTYMRSTSCEMLGWMKLIYLICRVHHVKSWAGHVACFPPFLVGSGHVNVSDREIEKNEISQSI